MATHYSILAWEIPWTEEAGGLQSNGSQESDTTQQPNHHHQGDPGLFWDLYVHYNELMQKKATGTF